MGTRSNNIHKWQIGVGTPDTISPSSIPNVAGHMSRIANSRAQNLLNDIKHDQKQSEADFRAKQGLINNISQSLGDLVGIIDKKSQADKLALETARAKEQQELETAQLRNDKMLASNVASDFANYMFKKSLDPNGFMHTPYRPTDSKGDSGSSSEKTLSEHLADFKTTNELYKTLGARSKEFADEAIAKSYGNYWQVAVKRDAENRFKYQRQTEANENAAYLQTLYATHPQDIKMWYDNIDLLQGDDLNSVTKLIFHEAYAEQRAGKKDYSDIFDFAGGAAFNNIKLTNAESKEKLKPILKQTVERLYMGATIDSMRTMCQSDDSAAVKLVFDEAYKLLDEMGNEEDQKILATQINAFAKKREAYLKNRNVQQVVNDNTALASTLGEINNNSEMPIEYKVTLLDDLANNIANSLPAIAESDPKLATEHGDAQLLAMATSIVNLINRDYTNTTDPLYNQQHLAAQREVFAYGDGVSYTTITDLKKEQSPVIGEALQLRDKRIEELRTHPILGGYIDKAIEERNKNVVNLSKAYYNDIKKKITAGSVMDNNGVVTNLNYVDLAIKIEQLHGQGLIDIEQRKELFQLAKSKQKLKTSDEASIKEAIINFLGIKPKDMDRVFNAIPEDIDYNLRDKYYDIIDIIPNKSITTRFHKSRTNKEKLEQDVVFALYQLGIEYYTNAELYTNRASFAEFLNELNQKGQLPMFTEWSNEQILNYINSVYDRTQLQGANLWMGNSRNFNINYPTQR